MIKRGIIALFIGLAVLAGCNAAPSDASPDCERREVGHIVKHGGQLEDDRFHLARGERVTCDDSNGRKPKDTEIRHEPERGDQPRHDDDRLPHKHRWWRND